MGVIKLAELRNKAGWTQAELSYQSGVSLSMIEKVESGKRRPGGDNLKKIADALGKKMDDFY